MNGNNAGKWRSRNNRRALKRKNEKLKKQLAVERAKKEKYKKRLQWLKKKKANSPSTSVNNMLRGQTVAADVKRKLLFGEILSEQIKLNFKAQRSSEEKRKLVGVISGNLIKKYKFRTDIKSLCSSRVVRNKCKKKINPLKDVKEKILEFYQRDEASRTCSGKK